MADSGFDFVSALGGGCAAGLATDLALYPLDTIKTRLQSADGFTRSGGLRGVYSGLGSVVVGSMPGAALFFATYEGIKALTKDRVPQSYLSCTHMLAASGGETVACLVRVPCEVVKQRTMVSAHKSSWTTLQVTVRHEGLPGLYRGYMSTVIREVPFSALQFPLWEYLKKTWSDFQQRPLDAWQSALCGAFAGGVSAAVTTPLDVAKTRIMLAERGTSLAGGRITVALRQVYGEKGVRGLFGGVAPRVLWISIGGAIFLGIYDKSKLMCSNFLADLR